MIVSRFVEAFIECQVVVGKFKATQVATVDDALQEVDRQDGACGNGGEGRAEDGLHICISLSYWTLVAVIRRFSRYMPPFSDTQKSISL